jgi:hypothetical protein
MSTEKPTRRYYNRNIETFLFCADEILGMHSNQGSIESALERGGMGASPSMDIPKEVLASLAAKGDSADWPTKIETITRAQHVWRQLSTEYQDLLRASYTATMRSEIQGAGFSRFPPGVIGQLSDPPGAALLLAKKSGKLEALLNACEHPTNTGAQDIIERWNTAGLEGQRLAHEAWGDLWRANNQRVKKLREALSEPAKGI